MIEMRFAAVQTEKLMFVKYRNGQQLARRARRASGAALVVVAVLALTACTSEKDRLDAEARRLCEIDGGIKVYETVTLATEKFNQYGQPLIPQEKDETGFGYFRRNEEKHMTGPFDSARSNLRRKRSQIVRTLDGKVMAEATVYGRSGGCLLDGYIQGCGFQCPPLEPWSLENNTFRKLEKQ